MVYRAAFATTLLFACGGDDHNQVADAPQGDAEVDDSALPDAVEPPATLTTASTKLSFAPTQTGTTSGAQHVSLTNGGAGSTGMLTAAITGTNASDFQLQNNTCTVLAPAATCGLDVVFIAGNTGAKSATLGVTGAWSGQKNLPIEGTSIPANALTISPSTFDFGLVEQSRVANKLFVLSNTTGASVTITSATVGGAPYFVVSNTCSTLAAGANCDVTVRFAPTGLGTFPANMMIATSGGTPSATISGQAGASPNVISTPTGGPVQMGTVIVGNNGAPFTFTLKNTGGFPTAKLPSYASTSTAFAVADTCAGKSLAVNDTCTMTVTFSPISAGAASAALSAMGMPTLNVAGTGLALGSVAVTPSQFAFPDTAANATSPPQTFSIQNTSGSVGQSINPTASANFQVQAGGTCPAGASTLAAGQMCTVVVAFAPTTSQYYTGTLTIGASTAAALSGRAP